jgi:ABC-type branched-subunit amino acid transport system substrate-binding protein
MISVQSLRLPSNGNSVFFFLVIFLFGLSSCDMFRKAQTDTGGKEKERTELDEIEGQGTYNPETGEYEPTTIVSTTIDTVKWTTDPDVAPPITSDATEIERPKDPIDNSDEGKGEKLSMYNVAVMLPFFTNRFAQETTLDDASLQAMSFYAGMKIAFNELAAKGIRINATVHDTKGSETIVESLMESDDIAKANLIIGPFRKNNIVIAGEKAKMLKTPFVSPLSASSDVANDNPYFIQVNPYLQTHCQAITQHARKRYKPNQIVLVARNKSAEISRFQYFQDENKKIEGSTTAERFKEYIITGEEMDFEEINIEPYLIEGDTTVFIVPSFSSKNFVYGLLLRIHNTKGDHPVVVYGFPQWMEYEPPSYDYYELLNLHVSSANYVNADKIEVKNFKKKYFQLYGTIPDERAYTGYDVMMYFGTMMNKYGTKFQERIDVETQEYLNSKFEFVREVPLAAALQEDFTKTNLYENKHVYILQFKDYFFQPAD